MTPHPRAPPTKGPWHWDAERIKVFDSRNRVIAIPICDMPGGDGAPPHEEIEPNARLIAAAPDLLAALKEDVRAHHHIRYHMRHRKDCEACEADAKARALIAELSPRPTEKGGGE
jgi:hypothetical protein